MKRWLLGALLALVVVGFSVQSASARHPYNRGGGRYYDRRGPSISFQLGGVYGGFNGGGFGYSDPCYRDSYRFGRSSYRYDRRDYYRGHDWNYRSRYSRYCR